jgi:methylenetetrahydrofolate dehydrogenase (NADP+)/methenyltetrahydrofolate cyclohydrolase
VRLIGFGPGDVLPRFIERKVRACAQVGVEALPVVLSPRATTRETIAAIERDTDRLDAIFVEFPAPERVDLDAVGAAIPEQLDVDVMSPARMRRFEAGESDPPVTVSAALALLAEHHVAIEGLRGVLVAPASPFTDAFRIALERAGARVERVAPAHAASAARAELVVVAAGEPRLVRTADLASRAVVIDVGYYNEGGVGDVDVAGGISHLRAICPVPGGIGPATIAMLAERVIEFAEDRSADS